MKVQGKKEIILISTLSFDVWKREGGGGGGWIGRMRELRQRWFQFSVLILERQLTSITERRCEISGMEGEDTHVFNFLLKWSGVVL